MATTRREIRYRTANLLQVDNDGTRLLNSFATVPTASTTYGDITVSTTGLMTVNATLTALAALTTTAFGRSLLEEATEATTRDSLGVGIDRGVDFTHFTSATAAASGFEENASGTGAGASQGAGYVNTTNGWLGAMEVRTGSTATGFASWSAGDGVLAVVSSRAYSLECLIATEALATIDDGYQAWWGFANNLAVSTVPLRGAYFHYDPSGRTSNNWFAVTRNAGTETATDTGVVATAGFTQAGKVFKIVLDTSGLTARFYIDGALEATHTTNMPAGTIGYGGKILKSVGTLEFGIGWDWNRFSWSGTNDL